MSKLNVGSNVPLGEIIRKLAEHQGKNPQRTIRVYDTRVRTSATGSALERLGLVWLDDKRAYIYTDDILYRNKIVFLQNTRRTAVINSQLQKKGYSKFRGQVYRARDIVNGKPADFLDEDCLYNEFEPKNWFGYGKADKMTDRQSPRTLYLGMEIELEFADYLTDDCRLGNSAEEIMCAAVWDGSLDDGVEIVTPPMDLDAIHPLLEKVHTSLIRRYDLHPEYTCGIHVHLSRRFLGKTGVANLSNFIYNPENKKYLVNFAGRESDDYASYDRKDGKYCALNTSLDHTVELRIFASTNQLERLKQIAEFADAVAMFAKFVGSINLTDFFDFIEQNKQRYPLLSAERKKACA